MKALLLGVEGFKSKKGDKYVKLNCCSAEPKAVNKGDGVFRYGRRIPQDPVFLPEDLWIYVNDLIEHVDKVINLVYDSDIGDYGDQLVDIEFMDEKGGENE